MDATGFLRNKGWARTQFTRVFAIAKAAHKAGEIRGTYYVGVLRVYEYQYAPDAALGSASILNHAERYVTMAHTGGYARALEALAYIMLLQCRNYPAPPISVASLAQGKALCMESISRGHNRGYFGMFLFLEEEVDEDGRERLSGAYYWLRRAFVRGDREAIRYIQYDTPERHSVHDKLMRPRDDWEPVLHQFASQKSHERVKVLMLMTKRYPFNLLPKVVILGCIIPWIMAMPKEVYLDTTEGAIEAMKWKQELQNRKITEIQTQTTSIMSTLQAMYAMMMQGDSHKRRKTDQDQ